MSQHRRLRTRLRLATWLGVLALGAWDIGHPAPARSEAFAAWQRLQPPGTDRGAALFALGDFGALDLDTLKTNALPWPLIAAALALKEENGQVEKVQPRDVETAFRRFGFLYADRILDHPEIKRDPRVPLGLSIGVVQRTLPPLRLTVINIGCAACHAGPAYRADGSPDPSVAVLGRPNTGLNLEAFVSGSYEALSAGFAREPVLAAAMQRLFPDMSGRERATLRWIAVPEARARLKHLAAHLHRGLPFRNGAPGLTNGVGALKARLGLTAPDQLDNSAGFVSVPDLADRSFRSALLADGAYAYKGVPRFHPVDRAAASAADLSAQAAIVSFFMVPTMGLSPQRTEAAIPELTDVVRFLSVTRAPPFPGPIDRAQAAAGAKVYARACASCHGTYDESLDPPHLTVFPNWAGDVGTDRSRVEVFNPPLAAAVAQTPHGRHHLDAASTGQLAAPLLSGVWASAPYFVNGSVPTLRHLLEPATRPVRFMSGGHRLDLERVGIAGTSQADGSWGYPSGYTPYTPPVWIDTREPGFSNRGHEREVSALSDADRDALLEYLKLL